MEPIAPADRSATVANAAGGEAPPAPQPVGWGIRESAGRRPAAPPPPPQPAPAVEDTTPSWGVRETERQRVAAELEAAERAAAAFRAAAFTPPAPVSEPAIPGWTPRGVIPDGGLPGMPEHLNRILLNVEIPDAPAPGYAYAGFWRRVGAALIDSALVVMLSVIGLTMIEVLTGAQGTPTTRGIFGLPLVWAYYVTLQVWQGQTVGMMALGLHLVRAEDGDRITIEQALIRVSGSYVSALVLCLGYLHMLWDRPHRQTWHDMMAKTYVVRRVA